MTSFEENGNVLRYRLDNLTRLLGELLDWRRDVDRERVQLDGRVEDLENSVKSILERVDALYKMFIGFIVTIAGSTIVLCLSILLATNKI